jgi:hypothetical protein
VNPSRILVAVPTRGNPDFRNVMGLQSIRDAAPGLPPIYYAEGRLGICPTRNAIVKAFLGGDFDHLIMVDDDVLPNEAMLGMVDHGVPIVAAPYYVRRPMDAVSISFPSAYLRRKDGLSYFPHEGVGLITDPDLAVATGCICIERRVLEAIPVPPFEFILDSDGDILETEDLNFCRKAKAHGFSIHADFDRMCEHFITVGAGANHGAYFATFAKVLEKQRARLQSKGAA